MFLKEESVMYIGKANNLTHLTISVLGIISIILVLSFGIYHNNTRPAAMQANTAKELSFKCVPVTPRDTLWSIASENYTEEYGSIEDYIQEIMRCNSLYSDNIRAGSYLIVPVYITTGSPQYSIR